jgi:hypothetical protein
MLIPQADLDAIPNNPISNYKYVAIHHSACNNQHQSAEDIAAEEKGRGYVTIPYNFVLDGAGKILVGRPISKLPAATAGLNPYAIAICFEGNFQSDDENYGGEKPTDEQVHAAVTIINEWLKPKCHKLHLLIAHRDAAIIEKNPANATACCGNLLVARLPEMRAKTGLGAP